MQQGGSRVSSQKAAWKGQGVLGRGTVEGTSHSPAPEEEWGEDPPLPTGCGDGKTQHKGTGTVQEPRSLDQSPGTKTDEAAPEEEVQRKG